MQPASRASCAAVECERRQPASRASYADVTGSGGGNDKHDVLLSVKRGQQASEASEFPNLQHQEKREKEGRWVNEMR